MVAGAIGAGQTARRATMLSVEETARSFVETHHSGHPPAGNIETDLQDAMRACQDRLRRECDASSACETLSATLTVAYVDWPRLSIIHAGDSRCYRFRNQRLEQITTDHTLAQRSVAQGVLDPERAASSPWNNVLYNALTSDDRDVHPETHSIEIAIGDTVLLCTKGLANRLPSHRIAGILREDRSAEESCQRLVDAAAALDGHDDLAVVVARFRSAERYQQLEAERERKKETEFAAPSLSRASAQ